MRKVILMFFLLGMSMQMSYATNDVSVFSDTTKMVVIAALAIMIVCLLVTKLAEKNGKLNGDRDSEFALEIKQAILNFEEEDFLAWVTERFVKFQKSWTKGALEELHPFETEGLFEMHKLQMADLKQKNIVNVIEGISVKETAIVSFSNKKEHYEVVVHVRATMRNYFIESNAPQEPQTISESFNYYLTFEKQKQNKKLTKCPACTAPVNSDMNHCEYCHTAFPEAMDQWLLSKMDVV